MRIVRSRVSQVSRRRLKLAQTIGAIGFAVVAVLALTIANPKSGPVGLGGGISFCEESASNTDVVFGVDVTNDGGVPATFSKFTMQAEPTVRVANVWVYDPSKARSTAAGVGALPYAEMSTDMVAWDTRSRVAGTTVAPHHTVELAVRLVLKPGETHGSARDGILNYSIGGLPYQASSDEVIAFNAPHRDYCRG